MITTKITEERIKEYLAQGKRFDGRALDEFREITIETNISKNAEGSARVRIGKTEVLVGVKMDVGEPYPDSADKGNLIVSAELLPLSSSRIESGPPKFDSIELGRLVDRGIRESKFIEMEKLCIKEGEKAWNVFIDVYSINDDGNLLDAAGIGAVVALKNAKMPKYDEKEGRVSFGEFTDKKVPLAKKTPFTITLHKIGNSWIVDPTKEEQDLVGARLTVGIADGIISSIQKGDSEFIKIDEFGKILEIVEKKWKELNTKVNDSLK